MKSGLKKNYGFTSNATKNTPKNIKRIVTVLRISDTTNIEIAYCLMQLSGRVCIEYLKQFLSCGVPCVKWFDYHIIESGLVTFEMFDKKLDEYLTIIEKQQNSN